MVARIWIVLSKSGNVFRIYRYTRVEGIRAYRRGEGLQDWIDFAYKLHSDGYRCFSDGASELYSNQYLKSDQENMADRRIAHFKIVWQVIIFASRSSQKIVVTARFSLIWRWRLGVVWALKWVALRCGLILGVGCHFCELASGLLWWWQAFVYQRMEVEVEVVGWMTLFSTSSMYDKEWGGAVSNDKSLTTDSYAREHQASAWPKSFRTHVRHQTIQHHFLPSTNRMGNVNGQLGVLNLISPGVCDQKCIQGGRHCYPGYHGRRAITWSDVWCIRSSWTITAYLSTSSKCWSKRVTQLDLRCFHRKLACQMPWGEGDGEDYAGQRHAIQGIRNAASNTYNLGAL